MAVNDDNIGWNRRRKFIPISNMLGLAGVASLGTGSAFHLATAAVSGLGGLEQDEGYEVYHAMPIPWDMDTTQPMRFRIWFVHQAASADAPIWKVDYGFFNKQVALVDVKVSPDETLTFDAHTCSTTDNSMEVTVWKESVSETLVRAGDFGILLAVELDNRGGAAAGEIILLGLEIQYTVAAAPNVKRLDTKGAPVSNTTPNS